MTEIEEMALDVEFLSCLIDKADNMLVLESDSHFSEFVGVHPSKIKQGKLFLHDVLVPQERETFMRQLCKKDSPYVYIKCHIKDHTGKYKYVHCTCRNVPNTTQCHITFADITRSIERSKQLKAQAKEMNHLIDMVNGGVCLFKVSQDMHFEVLYANKTCYRYFGTSKEDFDRKAYRLDELIHPDDKTIAYQAIGTSMATKKPMNIEVRVMQHKDEYIWCQISADIQRYDKDNCPIFHAFISDITDLKNAESVADRQRDDLVNVLKNVPGPIFSTDYDTQFIMNVVSEDFMKLTGYTRDELFTKYKGDLTKLMQPREVDMALPSIAKQLDESRVAKATYSLRTRNGRQILVVDKRKSIELDNGGRMTIGLLQDVTAVHARETLDI